MVKYILKRLAYMVIVFLILSVLLFCLFKMVPGDPARMMVEGQKMSVSPEKYEMPTRRRELVWDLISLW